MAKKHLKIDLNLQCTKENLNMMLHFISQESARSIDHRSGTLTTHISIL